MAMCCGILFLLSLLFFVSVFIASPPCVRFLFVSFSLFFFANLLADMVCVCA